MNAMTGFALDNRMTVVLFAGMGGGCDGLEDAGFHVHVAINHDPVAVAVENSRKAINWALSIAKRPPIDFAPILPAAPKPVLTGLPLLDFRVPA